MDSVFAIIKDIGIVGLYLRQPKNTCVLDYLSSISTVKKYKIIRKSIYSFIVFIILIAANLIGCDQEIIELMPIKDIEIYTTTIDLPDAPDAFAIPFWLLELYQITA